MTKISSFYLTVGVGLIWMLSVREGFAQTTTTYTYDAKGRMTHSVPSSGLSETITFDNANNITAIDVNDASNAPPVNSPPVCADITVAASGFSISGPFAEFLGIASCTDSDGDLLTGTSVTQPNNGAAVSINGDNILVEGVPPGSTVFTRTVTDGQGGNVTSTVTVVY